MLQRGLCEVYFFLYILLTVHLLPTGLPDSHPLECVIPDGVLIQSGPPDDEYLLLETYRGVEINTLRKIIFVLLIFTFFLFQVSDILL